MERHGGRNFSWDDGTKWVGGVIPNTGLNQVPASATFGNSIGGSTATVTVGRQSDAWQPELQQQPGRQLHLSDSNGRQRILTLANTGTPAQVTISGGGSHTIAVPVTLSGAVNVSGDTNSNLTFSNNIGGNGPLMVSGSGTVTLNGTNSTYTGGTAVNGGTLSVGPGFQRKLWIELQRPGLRHGDGQRRRHADRPGHALGYGYNSVAAPLTINGGVVTAQPA